MADSSDRPTGKQQSASSRVEGPLVRPVDRAEGRTYRVLVLLFLLTIPFAVVAGVGAANAQADAVADLAATTTEVTATTTEASRVPASMTSEYTATPAGAIVGTPAEWTLRGITYRGEVLVPADRPAGTATTITVGADGQRTAPIPNGVDIVVLGIFAGVSTLAVSAVTLSVIWAASVRRYERLRDREWDDALTRLLA